MESLIAIFEKHLGFSPSQVESILNKPLVEALKSVELNQELTSLDSNLLKKTLPTAGAVLAKELPPFYNWLKHELGVKRIPDSPEHTTTWVIGFVHNRESLTSLVDLHRPVPSGALEASVPRLVHLFDGVEDAQVRQEWQKAIAALCLVLVVAAREQDKLAVAT
ncbi:hypothetical protein H6G41_15055 [Tolypothrix sp. FACHB-123]|uniref:hypothetical protein n=1 Tax=Tolypothrix sp. FACHB-123 TaxID=2692868 RepID=UPI0016895608|nr:hypothetical protein [Tolypothrix sp. FACHB-123]MBD2355922.1 hypothetical protein [Tolypothrix sp. FACHB-123]